MSSEIRENFLTRVSSTLRRFRTSDKFATTLKDCFLVIPRHRRARRNDFVSARREQRRPRLACGPAHKPHLSRANVQITGRHAGFWHFSTERQNACSKFVLSTRHCGNPSSSPRMRALDTALLPLRRKQIPSEREERTFRIAPPPEYDYVKDFLTFLKFSFSTVRRHSVAARTMLYHRYSSESVAVRPTYSIRREKQSPGRVSWDKIIARQTAWTGI